MTENVPCRADEVPIWVMHGAPFGRLDVCRLEGVRGCPIQMERIREARPRICVFGHFHEGYGVERVLSG